MKIYFNIYLGWTHLESLLAGLCQRGYPNLSVADIERIVDGQRGKIRYEFDESRQRIRATHGHSAVPTMIYEAEIQIQRN